MPFLVPREPIGRSLSLVCALVSVGLLGALWAWLTYGGVVRRMFLPPPHEVWRTFLSMLVSGELLTHTLASLRIILIGWAGAAVVAVPLGILIGSFGFVSALLAPISSFARYLPVSALIPLIILYVGIDDGARISVIFIGTFFQTLLMVSDAAAGTSKDFIASAYTLGARRMSVVLRVIVPASLPGIVDTLRVNLGAAWTYVVVAEIIAAEQGLGHMILESMRGMFVSRIFCALLVIGLLGFIADQLFSFLHRRLLPWSPRVA